MSRLARFYSTVDLVNALEREKRDGKYGRITNQLLGLDLVILNELGCLPFGQSGDLFTSRTALKKSNKPQLVLYSKDGV